VKHSTLRTVVQTVVQFCNVGAAHTMVDQIVFLPEIQMQCSYLPCTLWVKRGCYFNHGFNFVNS